MAPGQSIHQDATSHPHHWGNLILINLLSIRRPDSPYTRTQPAVLPMPPIGRSADQAFRPMDSTSVISLGPQHNPCPTHTFQHSGLCLSLPAVGQSIGRPQCYRLLLLDPGSALIAGSMSP
ncbi:hypothetical protein ABBQ38_013038 [Trebouxia sp. C0009 RCD-2024]